VNPFGSAAGNAGRVDVQGVELVPSVGPFYGFTLSGGFTILDETHAGAVRPVRVPKRSAYGLAQYTHRGILAERDQVTLSLAYTFVGDRDDITPAGGITNHVGYHRFDATALYDARAAWRFVADEQLFARVNNVFDRHYSEALGFPSPRVNFVAGLQFEFE
jgi:outer membrane receptor protein involved in Fe transport